MPTPEEILTRGRGKKSPEHKKKKHDKHGGGGGDGGMIAVPSDEAGNAHFPVKPRACARAAYHAFRGAGRAVKLPLSGGSVAARFGGVGRKVDAAFFRA